ncbi:hypothetical protein G3444_07385 [Shewanella baltica]|uniref:hypothetical protein n=1 Tax=Shewanella baltica TaxID=62322 RepID=UPI00217D6093|nr:hypothetical protein [Shewanella baltica]MCS6118734.1 hypothetical protein [Shewanella baltica]
MKTVKKNSIFLLCSLLVAFLGLLKSLFFAKNLNFENLGLLALFQSAMALFSTFHFGILTGGYRLACYYNEAEYEKLNSVVFAVLFFLLPIFILILKLVEITGLISNVNHITYLALIAGFITWFSNWAINVSIARENLSSVNTAQILGVVFSLFFLPMVFSHGIYAAYFSVIIQPLIIVLFLAVNTSYTLPRKINFDIEFIKKILRAGFFPFLAGLFFISYQQLEKIFIGYALGVEYLGHLTIYYLALTVWIIIPDALTRIYYPKATKFYELNNIADYRTVMNQHLLIVILYSLVCSFFLYFFSGPIVLFFLDAHVDFVVFVQFGAIAFTLRSISDSFSIRLLAKGKNPQVFFSDLSSFIFYLFLIIVAFKFFGLSLIGFVVFSILYYLFKLFTLSYYCFRY